MRARAKGIKIEYEMTSNLKVPLQSNSIDFLQQSRILGNQLLKNGN